MVPRVAISHQEMPAKGRCEWLLTNGLGGFAMGTVQGIPTRRYHGWLVGATRPPVGRILALHSCVEWLVVESAAAAACVGLTRLDLASYQFADGSISPKGSANLRLFEKGTTCRWTYRFEELDGIEVTRELMLHRGMNAATLSYSVSSTNRRAWLEVRPLAAMRDFHALRTSAAIDPVATTNADETGVLIRGAGEELRLELAGGPAVGRYTSDREHWRAFEYERDRERGQDSTEDLFSPGVFICECGARTAAGDGSPITIRAWLAGAAGVAAPLPGDAAEELVREQQRLEGVAAALVTQSAGAAGAEHSALSALAAAADQFVVRRDSLSSMAVPGVDGDALTTIIAGYPWFSDWGRDAMISLRGLLLTTGRFAEAREVLEAFASLRRRGLIANCFDDGSGAAQYNTVDASLWFLHAACEYLRHSGDRAGFSGKIRTACLEVIDAYRSGTDYGIRLDPSDGLISAGDVNTQLTWMDAKRDGIVFTPRHGKAVEINALWYSGLLELADAVEPDQPRTARELRQVADVAGRSFSRSFWNEKEQCLFDCLTPRSVLAGPPHSSPYSPVAQVRPNQVFAVSQPYSPLSPEQRRLVIRCIFERLLTPFGLRTLCPADPAYRPRFEGPLIERDAAYHNGTVWPWLIGPFCEGLLRVEGFSEAARDQVRQLLRPLIDEVGVGREGALTPLLQMAEVYDGEELPGMPRRPEGCMAQAWSVAEVLRVLALATCERS